MGYCIGQAFFRGWLAGRDPASSDHGVKILFDDFHQMGLVFGSIGGCYAGHYEFPENDMGGQYYRFLEQRAVKRQFSAARYGLWTEI